MKNIIEISFQEIMILKEAFYSCRIEGINENTTFEKYLRNEVRRRSTKNKFKLRGSKRNASPEQLAKTLEGSNTYVGDFWITDIGKVCTVFFNSTPNLDKGHKNYPFLFYSNGVPTISALSLEEWNTVQKVKI